MFTSLFIAACAAAMTAQTAVLFHLAPSLSLLGFVFSGTVSSYNFHWFLTPPGAGSHSAKGKWSLRNKRIHLLLSLSALITALYFGLQLISHAGWLLSTAFFTFLYSAPKIPWPAFAFLKRVAVGKTIFLALAWTHVTALLPLVLQNSSLSNTEIGFVVNRFFFLYAVCIVFDYRDRDRDRQEQIRSLVTMLPERGIDRLFWGSLLAFGASLLSLWFYLPVLPLLSLLLPGLVLAAMYRRFKKDHSDYLYYFVLDGLMALSAPLVILATFAR